MNFISNEDLIYSRFPEELKYKLNELQHEMLSTNNIMYKFELNKYIAFAKLLKTFFVLKGYNVDEDENSIYIMIID